MAEKTNVKFVINFIANKFLSNTFMNRLYVSCSVCDTRDLNLITE